MRVAPWPDNGRVIDHGNRKKVYRLVDVSGEKKALQRSSERDFGVVDAGFGEPRRSRRPPETWSSTVDEAAKKSSGRRAEQPPKVAAKEQVLATRT